MRTLANGLKRIKNKERKKGQKRSKEAKAKKNESEAARSNGRTTQAE